MVTCHPNAHWMKQAKTTCAQQLRCLVLCSGALETAWLTCPFSLHRACFDECWSFALCNTWKVLSRKSLADFCHIFIRYGWVCRKISQTHFHSHRRLGSVLWCLDSLPCFQKLVDVPGSRVLPVVTAHMRCNESCLLSWHSFFFSQRSIRQLTTFEKILHQHNWAR